ncbi:Serine/threonine-protein kinase PknB [Phycisphaerae bacterium RAS2]|nr:Serine/threonine-protein kinase PknB [Phycisphaerae bacterium RAS2]
MDLAEIAAGPANASAEGGPNLPGYRLIEPLSTSGQGRVFRAIRLSDARKVAVKLIRSDRLADSQARARFQQEARTLAMLEHPSIVQVIEQGEIDDGQPWFATEYISGLPLNEYVNKLDGRAIDANGSRSPGPFPLHEVLALFVQVCDAVQAAHNVGVLHRDLKPSNILVDDEGQPHVLDFGLAKSPDVTDPALVTLTGQFLGSPAWCSPEQIEARPSAIDVRSDVYSLGVILYNLLTGEFPYPVDRPLAELFDAIRHAEPTRPSAHTAFIDDDLDTILLKAIAKEKERRYQSAGDLRDEAQHYLRGEPIRAKGDGWAYVTTKLLRRHPVLTGISAAVFILSLAYCTAMTVLCRRAVSAETQAKASAADARQKFRMAQQTAEAMLSQVDEVLKKTAGMGQVRQRLLAQLSSQFEVLTQEQSDDPVLQSDLAMAHTKLADVYQSIDEIQRAAVHAEAALTIRQRLVAAFPDDNDAHAAHSIAIVRVGDIVRENGEAKRGRKLYEHALRIDEALVAKRPENLNFLDNLSWSYARLAHLAVNRGDDAEAARLFKERSLIADRLVVAEPNSPARLMTLLDSYVQTSALEPSGDTLGGPFGLERARRAAELADRLMAIDPENLEYIRHYITSRTYLSTALTLKHQDDEADANAIEALDAARRMVRKEPNAVMPRVLLSNCLSPHCDRARRRRNWSLVSEIGREILESNQKLVEIKHGAVENRHHLFSTHHRLATTAWMCGQSDEAIGHMTEALAIVKVLAIEEAVMADRLWEYARGVLDAKPPEFADPMLALQYAERAAALSERPGPEKLELLARVRETVLEQTAQGAVESRE